MGRSDRRYTVGDVIDEEERIAVYVGDGGVAARVGDCAVGVEFIDADVTCVAAGTVV